MTNQEAFDIMVEHLGNLKKRSMQPGSTVACVYNGSKCAVGILMTDVEQEKFGTFEGKVEDLLIHMLRIGYKSHLHQLNRDMIADMQVLHDCCHNWNYRGFTYWGGVKEVARRYTLEYKGPKA